MFETLAYGLPEDTYDTNARDGRVTAPASNLKSKGKNIYEQPSANLSASLQGVKPLSSLDINRQSSSQGFK